MTLQAAVGKRIRSQRMARGLSQTQLARLLGCSHVTVWRYEAGKISPSMEALKGLAKVLRVKVDFIITGAAA